MDQSDTDKPDISLFTSSNVVSSTGESVFLSTLFRPNSVVILTLIRHFSCGACMSFVQALSEQISLDELAKANAGIVIVGNGDHKHIDDYAEMTKCPFTIYTDPERDLFKKLDLGSMKMSNPSTPEPTYSNRGVLGDTMLALQTFVKKGTFSTGGDFKQLGGDYVFKTGKSLSPKYSIIAARLFPDDTDETGKTTCIFARKMPNSRSHTDPATLNWAEAMCRCLLYHDDIAILFGWHEMSDIPFIASYNPVFRPDTVGRGSAASASSSDQQLSISAGSSTRKAHFRRLYDIWQLSVQRNEIQQAKRAYSLLVRFSEFDWATNWRTGIAMVNVEDGNDLLDAQIKYLRECHAVHSRPATARAATREPIAVLLQLVLLLIQHQRYQQALSELDLYLNTYPYRDDAGLHEYAGMLAVSLAQIEAHQQISQDINKTQPVSSNNKKRRHSSASSSSSSNSSSSSSSASSDNENSAAPSASRKRNSKGKFRQTQSHHATAVGGEDNPAALPFQSMQRPSVKTVQRLVQDAPTMIMDARRYFERAIEISTMAMEEHDDNGASGSSRLSSELAEMWLDLLNGREPTERIIHQAPPTSKASKTKAKNKRKTRSVSAATASSIHSANANSSSVHARDVQDEENEDQDEDDNEGDVTLSNAAPFSRSTFGSLERQSDDRRDERAMLSD